MIPIGIASHYPNTTENPESGQWIRPPCITSLIERSPSNRFLKRVLYGEVSIALNSGARDKRVERGARWQSNEVEDLYFAVREGHCRGHAEDRTQTVRECRRGQNIEHYAEIYREWRDIIIKKWTSGPTMAQPLVRSMPLFDMCSYDLDSFCVFV